VIVGEPDVRDTYTNLHVEAGKLIITDQTGGLRASFFHF
jgi:hypothetical protein